MKESGKKSSIEREKIGSLSNIQMNVKPVSNLRSPSSVYSNSSQAEFGMNLASSMASDNILMDDIVDTMNATPMGPGSLLDTNEIEVDVDAIAMEGDEIMMRVTPNGDIANLVADVMNNSGKVTHGGNADEEFVIHGDDEDNELLDDETNEGTDEEDADDVDIVQSINTLK